MGKIIDCLFIGHNEVKFAEHEKMLKLMGTTSGAYRDLELDFIQYNNRLYTAPEIFNHFYGKRSARDGLGPFNLGNVFSATIAYLGTYLHRRGYNFAYVNSFQNEKELLADMLEEDEIRVIAIPTTLYVSVLPILEIISFIRRHNDTAKIVLGGPFVAAQIRSQDEESLQYFFKSINADIYVNSAQGEATLGKILQVLSEGGSFAQVANIYYRNNDTYVKTATEPENNPLEANMVDWNLFTERLQKIVGVRTAISCPFSCSYCEYPEHAGKYQTVSVSAVERELDSLAATGKVTSIGFIDDTFNVPPERFKEILRMMIRNKYQFKWNSFFRCQYADREMVELMKESGCEGVYLGIESGNQQILQNMHKAVSVDQYRTGISLLKEYDFNILVSILVGFPGETEETVKDTVKFIEEMEPTFLRVHLWYCSQLTAIWREREKFGIRGSQFEWNHATMDSHLACDLIHDLVFSLQKTIYIPQYNFDFAGVINLLNRGLSLEQVKQFLRGFNLAVQDKFINSETREASAKAVEMMRLSLEEGKASDAESN